MKKLSITKTKFMLCIDMEVRCKRMSTAYRHFYNAVKSAQEDGAFGDYDLVGDILIKPEELDWQYDSPLFKDMENTGYVVWMEPTDNDNWYLWANVSNKRVNEMREEVAEMKNVVIPMNEVMPVTDELILKLVKADTVNGRVFRYMSEEGGEGYSTDMWLDYYKHYADVVKPAKDVYGGILLRPMGDDDIEAILYEK